MPKYNFSSTDLRSRFIERIKDRHGSPLPNLRWVKSSDASRHRFFSLGGVIVFTRFLRPRQLPKFVNKKRQYDAQCILTDDMTGLILMADRELQDVHFGTFAFCDHQMTVVRHQYKDTEHVCSKCGYNYTTPNSR